MWFPKYPSRGRSSLKTESGASSTLKGKVDKKDVAEESGGWWGRRKSEECGVLGAKIRKYLKERDWMKYSEAAKSHNTWRAFHYVGNHAQVHVK